MKGTKKWMSLCISSATGTVHMLKYTYHIQNNVINNNNKKKRLNFRRARKRIAKRLNLWL